ncbi:MAG TPA: PDZ domain-containing protein, partial [Candidatus Dormibacteraeota bacterium]
PGTSAAHAGIAVGDVIVSANGTILDPAHPLARMLHGMAVRQGVALTLKSGTGRRTLSLDVELVSW